MCKRHHWRLTLSWSRRPTKSLQQLFGSSGRWKLQRFVHKDARSSAAQDTSEQNPFLFVNETTSSPAFKHGGRQDIRSHVRKHVAKRFRQNHKAGKAVREEKSKVTRYLLIASQIFADSEYTHTQDCGHDQELLSSVPQANIEHSSTVPTAKIFFKPEVFSSSASGSKTPTGTEVNSMPPTTAEYNISSSFDIPDEGTLQDVPQFFCPTCGSHISSTKREGIERRDAIALARRISSRPFFNHSSVEILASGRVDPFFSYPVKKQPLNCTS